MKDLVLHQRRILGILCILLAPLSLGFGLLGDNAPQWWYSISATYYANSKMFMIGLLCCTALFFFSYRGYDWKDKVATIIAGVSALGVVIFPCECMASSLREGLFNLPIKISNVIHCISASILFSDFAFIIGYLFPKSNGNPTEEKKKRNLVYYICCGVIVVFAIWECTFSLVGLPKYWTVINEWVMLTSFGIAWLVKGESIKFLNDKYL